MVKSEMDRVSIVESNDRIFVYTSNSLRLRLQQIGWSEFIRKFHGYNFEVSKQFAAIFDGQKAVIGNLDLPVTQ